MLDGDPANGPSRVPERLFRLFADLVDDVGSKVAGLGGESRVADRHETENSQAVDQAPGLTSGVKSF